MYVRRLALAQVAGRKEMTAKMRIVPGEEVSRDLILEAEHYVGQTKWGSGRWYEETYRDAEGVFRNPNGHSRGWYLVDQGQVYGIASAVGEDEWVLEVEACSEDLEHPLMPGVRAYEHDEDAAADHFTHARRHPRTGSLIVGGPKTKEAEDGIQNAKEILR
jgi:hypothetical protein